MNRKEQEELEENLVDGTSEKSESSSVILEHEQGLKVNWEKRYSFIVWKFFFLQNFE